MTQIYDVYSKPLEPTKMASETKARLCHRSGCNVNADPSDIYCSLHAGKDCFGFNKIGANRGQWPANVAMMWCCICHSFHPSLYLLQELQKPDSST